MRIIKKADRLKRPVSQPMEKERAKRSIPRKLKIQRMFTKGVHAVRTATTEYSQLNGAEAPSQYANDKSIQMVRAASSKAVPIAVKGSVKIVRGTLQAGKAAIRFARERSIKLRVKSIKTKSTVNKKTMPTAPHPTAYRAGQNRTIEAARRRVRQSVTRKAAKAGHTAETVAQAQRRTVKAVHKTVKSATHSIKTAKDASVNVKAAAQTIKTTVRATPKAMQLAKIAGKTAIATAKLAAKAVVAVGKALIAAVQVVIAFLMAGGGLVALVVIVVALIACLFGSAFGIFFTDDAENGALTQAVIDIQMDFTDRLQEEIDRLSSAGAYDAVNVHYDGDFDGDSFMANNWTDVLAVYAVKIQYEGSEVLSMSPEKQRILQQIFHDMNPVEYRTEVETETYMMDDEEFETSTLHIYVTISSLDYLEGAALYHFTQEQIELLEELMSPDFYELFAGVLKVDVYGGVSKSELLEIVYDLPAGTKGSAIVQAAAQRIGTPYSKLDCSKLVQTVYADVGVSLPRTSVEQARYCYENGYTISASQLQPGDLIFWSKPGCSCGRWQEVHHVGIFIGNGQIIDASSAKGRVVLRDVWSGSTYTIVMYARPLY